MHMMLFFCKRHTKFKFIYKLYFHTNNSALHIKYQRKISQLHRNICTQYTLYASVRAGMKQPIYTVTLNTQTTFHNMQLIVLSYTSVFHKTTATTPILTVSQQETARSVLALVDHLEGRHTQCMTPLQWKPARSNLQYLNQGNNSRRLLHKCPHNNAIQVLTVQQKLLITN